MTVSIERKGEIAVVAVDNPPVNALSQAVRAGLMAAAEELDRDPAVGAVVLICRGRTFIAGADISEFGKPSQPPSLPDLIDRIEAAEKPWLAAIHGTALGGGFELALGCRLRIATATAKVGLPEVTLGLIPGAGGTVRLPRAVGVKAAIDMIAGGRPVSAVEAKALGAIDALIEDDLEKEALTFAKEALRHDLPDPLRNRRLSDVPDDSVWAEQETRLSRRARGQRAPLLALQAVRNAVELDFEKALRREREIFIELRQSDQSKALRHVFFAERAAGKLPELEGVEARNIVTTGVVGGGTMGVGITAALLDAGFPVVLLERDRDALDRGVARLRRLYDSGVERGRLAEAAREERLARLTPALDYKPLAAADLVIEAVFEDLDVKRTVFRSLDAVCKPGAVLATNTSYLDPNLIAAATSRPESVVGLHFFSPANVMTLLEIVRGNRTTAEVLKTAFVFAKRIGKVAVLAGVCDGFIGNRILKTYRRQAEQLLLDGSQPADVDRAMRAFGMPMGPFEAQDLGGLDIAQSQRAAARTRGESVFAPIADRLCALQRYGQKSGGGWYDYAPGERTPQPSDTVAAIIAEEAEKAGRKARVFDSESIERRILFPMIDEGARILDEGIARRSSDIDLVEIHGYGFPRWRGGLLYYAEQCGLDEILAALEDLAAESSAVPPCDLLRRAARAGGFERRSG